MKRRLLTITLVIIFAFSMATSVLAQSYSFSLDKEVVNVYWNSDGTVTLDYVFTFTNQPGAHAIDFVDVGLPNNNYIYNTIRADVNGSPVSISTDYQGSGSGVAVDMGSHAIQPGQTGNVHVTVGQISDVIYQDDQDQNYASAVFSPTWFGSEFVVGDTNLTVTFHLPPGVKPEEPRWHDAPSGFPSEPQTGFDSENRVTYTWSNPNASGSRQYTFGASFPKTYIPPTAIVTAPAFNIGEWISSLVGGCVPIAFICFFAFMFLGIPVLTFIGNQRRTKRDPLTIEVTSPLPEGLYDYELNFLKAFKEADPKARRNLLQEMTVKLVRSVSEKMKGFSRRETIEYYKRIMETAWEQVQKADTPEVQMAFFDQQLEWTMLDKDYDERSRRVFHGPVFLPMWWGNYDPTYRTGPISTSGGGRVSAPSQPSGRTSLPGADFAASVVGGVQTFSQRVIGNVNDFTSRVTNVTNPPPKPTTSGRSMGGGGRGCACACACAGCACACAGGGR